MVAKVTCVTFAGNPTFIAMCEARHNEGFPGSAEGGYINKLLGARVNCLTLAGILAIRPRIASKECPGNLVYLILDWTFFKA